MISWKQSGLLHRPNKPRHPHVHPRRVQCRLHGLPHGLFLRHVQQLLRCYLCLLNVKGFLSIVDCLAGVIQSMAHLKHKAPLLNHYLFVMRVVFVAPHLRPRLQQNVTVLNTQDPHQVKTGVVS